MAKKPTQKSTKIKNNNIKKENYTKALNQEPLIDEKLDEEIKINVEALEKEAQENIQDQTQTIHPQTQSTSESVKVKNLDEESNTQTNNTSSATNQTQEKKPEQPNVQLTLEQENLALKNEVIQLTKLVENLKEENLKLKSGVAQSQQQLIDKLKEKQNEAKEQLEARLEQLEKDKQSEIEQRRDSIYVDVVTQFLTPFLLFEKTINAPIANEAARSYVQGYNMICNMFKDTFNTLGIEQIVVNPGDEFNHNFMEAFDTESNPAFKPNQVTKVVDKGFVYKGKVIKYTTVVVNK